MIFLYGPRLCDTILALARHFERGSHLSQWFFELFTRLGCAF